MKQIVITLLMSVLGVQCVSGGIVSPERAARYAGEFMGMKTVPVQENGNVRMAPGRDVEKAPCFYVFNNPDGGWVIISADDRVTPILAYSDAGSFSMDNLPENTRWWMDGIAETIEMVQKSDLKASAEASAAWNSLQNGLSASVAERKVLETALWYQEWPYNEMCPIVSGENKRAVTGCLATAMAIVLRYNRWPVKGKGVIGGYVTDTYQTYIPSFSIEDHIYDWDKMPLDDGETNVWDDEQIRQVARLMYDCGVSISMDYTEEEGSSSYHGFVPDALKQHFSYSEKIIDLSRSSYTSAQWFSIMKNEIDEGRVILYGGFDDGSGHAFVCDGYDASDSRLHINWGFSGSYNGFFTLDMKMGRYKFSQHQAAIVGIAPDTCQVILGDAEQLSHFMVYNLSGMSPVTPVDMKQGSPVQFEIGYFQNQTQQDVIKEFKVCLMDRSGTVRQEGWHATMSFPAVSRLVFSETTEQTVLEVTPDFTDYFKLFVKDDNGEWSPMTGNYDFFPGNDGIICGVTPDPVMILPSDCIAGQEIELELTYGFVPVKSVKWTVNGSRTVSSKAILRAGSNSVRADIVYFDGSKGTIMGTVTAK